MKEIQYYNYFLPIEWFYNYGFTQRYEQISVLVGYYKLNENTG